MYRVEIHANILQTFLDENWKQEMGKTQELLLTVLIIAIMALLFFGLKINQMKVFLLLTAVITVAYWAVAGIFYENGYLLPLLYPMVTPIILSIYHVGYQYLMERKAKKRLEGIFGKYVSKEVAASIVKGGEDALKLGGQKKDVAVLFVDIRGFTPLSESLPPEKVVKILNRYLELTTKAVFDNKGTVDKFIGDAMMAIYNAPLDLDDYVLRAVKTGLDMAAARNLEKELTVVTDKKGWLWGGNQL